MSGGNAPPLLWRPGERAIEEAQVTQFARQVIRKRQLDLNTYAEFHRWTVENPEEFWSEVWDSCGVVASRKGSSVLTDGDKMPGARWFPEARLNFAENLMRRGVHPEHPGSGGARARRAVPRHRVVVVLAGLRRRGRARALYPDRPEGSLLRRRLQL